MRKRNWLGWIVAGGMVMTQLAACIAPPAAPGLGGQLAGAAVEQAANPWIVMGSNYQSVSAANDGTVWSIDNSNIVWRYNGSGWDRVGSGLKQVAVANAGAVWAIQPTVNGLVLRTPNNGVTWGPIMSAPMKQMKQIAVSCDGVGWGVDDAGSIWRYSGNSWDQIPGVLKQIAQGKRDQVWGVNGAGEIFRYNGSGWDLIPGTLTQVAVGCDGTVMGINGAGQVYRYNGSGWTNEIGILSAISVGSATQIWGINAGYLYRWSPPAPPASAGSGLTAQEEQAVLQSFNSERQLYPGVAPLQWSPQIAAVAQRWAQEIVNAGNVTHSSDQFRRDNNPLSPGQAMGENIVAGEYKASFSMNPPLFVGWWNAEKEFYHYEQDDGYGSQGRAPGCTATNQWTGQSCGHFTQNIWKNTQYVGCGWVKSNSFHAFVCQYYPVGNVAGQKPY